MKFRGRAARIVLLTWLVACFVCSALANIALLAGLIVVVAAL
jgi:hypothetical protein